jgi:hypothetical protein
VTSVCLQQMSKHFVTDCEPRCIAPCGTIRSPLLRDVCIGLQELGLLQQREVARLKLERDVGEGMVVALILQRDNAEERLEDMTDQRDEATIAVDSLHKELSRTCRKLDASSEAAGPLVDSAADMTTPAVEAAVPCLRGRIQQLERELAGRKSLPAHTAPAGTACAVTCCEHPVEVQLPCGNGHYLCRPCHGQLCRTGG